MAAAVALPHLSSSIQEGPPVVGGPSCRCRRLLTVTAACHALGLLFMHQRAVDAPFFENFCLLFEADTRSPLDSLALHACNLRQDRNVPTANWYRSGLTRQGDRRAARALRTSRGGDTMGQATVTVLPRALQTVPEMEDDVPEPVSPAQLRHMAELSTPVSRAADLLGEEFPEWQERALCAQTDPEAFFPEKGGSTREAKKICVGCDVKSECLEYALAHDERFGIWGGLSERERRKLRKRVA